jgi:hypothetical protein
VEFEEERQENLPNPGLLKRENVPLKISKYFQVDFDEDKARKLADSKGCIGLTEFVQGQ